MKTIGIFFLVLVSFVHPDLRAQVNMHNDGILYVTTSSDILFINGSFVNSSTGLLTNNGLFHVKYDLTNDETSMVIGTGKLFLDGSTAQTVSGSQVFNTNDLETNNSAGITLNSNLSVSGVHSYVNGNITTSATPNYLIYQAGSSHTGSNDGRHVNGWAKKLGNTDFIFPIGDATYERTIKIKSLSTTFEFNAKYIPPAANPYTMSSSGTLVAVHTLESWQLNMVSGAGYSAIVELNWENSKVHFPNWLLADIRVANYWHLWSTYTGWGSVGGSATGNVTTTGSIASSAIVTFGEFTLGSTSIAVPLTLVNFAAEKNNNVVNVNWITDNEYNVDRFCVERSNDGTNYLCIATIAARNSGNREIYSYTDNIPVTGTSYYRLRSTDIDGKEKLSQIVSVKNEDDNRQLQLIGNPVQDHIFLRSGSNLAGMFDYNIISEAGLMIQKGELAISNNSSYQIQLNRKINKGIYLLIIHNRQKKFTFKIMID